MLSMRTVLERDGVAIADVTCRHRAGRGLATEHAGQPMVVLVRRGCFVRSVDGVEATLDPTLAYCMNAGDEQRYDHPHDHGDDCTALLLDPELLAGLWGGEPALPRAPLPVGPDVDLAHRLLLAAAGLDADGHELVERAITLVAGLLERADAPRVASGRPATAQARRALANAAREALAEDPGRSLPELAAALAASPHHLSRVVRDETGHAPAALRTALASADATARAAHHS